MSFGDAEVVPIRQSSNNWNLENFGKEQDMHRKDQDTKRVYRGYWEQWIEAKKIRTNANGQD